MKITLIIMIKKSTRTNNPQRRGGGGGGKMDPFWKMSKSYIQINPADVSKVEKMQHKYEKIDDNS